MVGKRNFWQELLVGFVSRRATALCFWWNSRHDPIDLIESQNGSRRGSLAAAGRRRFMRLARCLMCRSAPGTGAQLSRGSQIVQMALNERSPAIRGKREQPTFHRIIGVLRVKIEVYAQHHLNVLRQMFSTRRKAARVSASRHAQFLH